MDKRSEDEILLSGLKTQLLVQLRSRIALVRLLTTSEAVILFLLEQEKETIND